MIQFYFNTGFKHFMRMCAEWSNFNLVYLIKD